MNNDQYKSAIRHNINCCRRISTIKQDRKVHHLHMHKANLLQENRDKLKYQDILKRSKINESLIDVYYFDWAKELCMSKNYIIFY